MSSVPPVPPPPTTRDHAPGFGPAGAWAAGGSSRAPLCASKAPRVRCGRTRSRLDCRRHRLRSHQIEWEKAGQAPGPSAGPYPQRRTAPHVSDGCHLARNHVGWSGVLHAGAAPPADPPPDGRILSGANLGITTGEVGGPGIPGMDQFLPVLPDRPVVAGDTWSTHFEQGFPSPPKYSPTRSRDGSLRYGDLEGTRIAVVENMTTLRLVPRP